MKPLPGPIVFLGDSLTAGHDWGRSFPALAPINLGLSGDTCAGLRARLEEAITLRPARVCLQIGLNDLLRGAGAAEIVAGHRLLWEELAAKAPQARLRVVSLLPCLEDPYLPSAQEITAINQKLSAAADQSRLPFLDAFSALADEKGFLRREYTYDGLHLTPRAYQAWAEVLRPFLEDDV